MPDSEATDTAPAAPPGDTANRGTLRALLPRRTRKILVAFFLLSFALYLATSSAQFRSIDDENLYSTAHSLTTGRPNVDICQGTNQVPDYLYARGPFGCLDFNQPQLLKSYRINHNKKYVSKYGIGVPLIATPFFGVGRAVSHVLTDKAVGTCKGPTAIACCKRLIRSPDEYRANCQGNTRDMIIQTTTLFTNSLVTAITLVLVMIVSLQLGASLRGAALIGVVFGFGSYAFAYAKTLGAEPGTAMCLILAVMFAIDAARSGRIASFVACGLAAGAAVLFRNTALIFLPILGIWFLWPKDRNYVRAIRNAALFSAGALAMLIVFAMFNHWRYGNFLTLGYNQSGTHVKALRSGGSLVTGLWGQWLSPGKSVLLYAPFVFLALAGIVISVRRFPREVTLLIALVVVNTLLFARVRFWSGDWAWGPRYMIIVLPCLAVMCAPLVNMHRWRNALAVLGGLGVLFPGVLGVVVNFNTFYQRANRSLGVTFRNAVYHDWSMNPIWHHLKILGQEWGNFGRPAGLLYVTGQPRFDIWWLDDRWWILDHPRRLTAAVLMLLVIAALAISGALLLRNALRRPVATADADAEVATEPATSDLAGGLGVERLQGSPDCA